MAYRAGAPVSTIAAHGRWAPTSPVVLGYIRAVDRWATTRCAEPVCEVDMHRVTTDSSTLR